MKNTKMTIIEELNQIANELISKIEFIGKEKKKNKEINMPVKGTSLYMELERRFALESFRNLLNCIKKEDTKKAKYHAEKLKKYLRPVANDFPFKEKDKVWIVRDEHNYEPGTTAIIKKVHKNSQGIYSYSATVIDSHQGEIEQYDIQIQHTRDAHLTY